MMASCGKGVSKDFNQGRSQNFKKGGSLECIDGRGCFERKLWCEKFGVLTLHCSPCVRHWYHFSTSPAVILPTKKYTFYILITLNGDTPN